MKILIYAFSILAVLSCSHAPKKPAAPQYKSAAEMPVEEFFRNPEVYGFRISPDGQKVAVLKPWKNRLNVFVFPLANPQAAKQITFVEERDIGEVHWKGTKHILFERDTNGDENDHVFGVNIETGDTKDLTPFPGVKAGLADDLEESSATDIIISHNHRNKELFDLYRVNVETGESKMIAENKNTISDWLIDHEGQVRGGVATDGVNQVFYYEKEKGKGFVPVFKTGFRNHFRTVAFAADNQMLYVETNLGRDLAAIVEIDPRKPIKASSMKKVIYEHPKYDVEDAEYSPKRKALNLVTVVTDRREMNFLNPDDQKEWESLKTQFPQASLLMANDSLDERYWLFKTHLDTSRGAYYVYDRETRKTTEIGQVSPWIRPELMSPMKTVRYKTRDGLEIEGYLTVPQGKEAKNLPVVINPHGGPWARDEWRFNPEIQFLASRGYAVFQMNFRGSTGYGRKFWEKSFKQWGRTMQDDITDGVNWLIKENIADAKKICIYGASYGGYATLAGVAFTPDLYACGVDYVGVSNLFTFMNTIPPYWKPYLAMLHAQVGHPVKDKKLLRAASPVFFVEKIKAPLFVAQGATDPRVNKAESDQIVEALRKRGVEVEYMIKENEGHGFANEENRFDFYRAMEKFLAKHLPQGA